MQVSSSLSSRHLLSTTTGETSPYGDTTVRSQSEETVISIESGSSDSDAGGMAILLGGEATAVGEDTVAIGTIEGQIADVGTGIIGEGSATFAAAGQTSDDAIAFAFADSYAAGTESDTVVLVTSKRTETVQSTNGSAWTEVAEAEILAVDLELSSSIADTDLGIITTAEPAPFGDVDTSTMQSDEIGSDGIDGNVAMIVIDVQAYADDSLVVVDASALTVDNLSIVTGSALFGVG
jgi:hypothetical protein